MNAPIPMWNDRRQPDWERATLRQCPDLLPAWAETRPPLRARLARWWDVVEFALACTGWLLLVAVLAIGLTY